ncbi:MAG TPA: NADH-quinone oxidoreductase subunit C [Myxococcota bacterium]|nr:NADH-quinone oxidoreductase subunit C [Myxococcota bacterium]
MSSADALLRTQNSVASPMDEVPELALEELQGELVAGARRGERVAALFGAPEANGTRLVAVLASDRDGTVRIGRSAPLRESFPSLTPHLPAVHLFEREIFEQHDLRPEGHPWPKPVRFPPRAGVASAIGIADFYKIDGDEVHEVGVGPVHAGVIEPGHFRFQCHGENVMHLEISLGYQHRGVERAVVTGDPRRRLHYLETAAGDTTIGHATAYAQLVEALAGSRVSARAHALRAIALELERMANHTGDLGALAGDVGFQPTAAFCGRLRGDWLNLSAELCGNRFGRGLVRPGGLGFDVDAARVGRMAEAVERAVAEVGQAADLLWDTPSVMSRFEDTGRVTREQAEEVGLVGPAARASGLTQDVRTTHPTGIYRVAQIPAATWDSGDVFARAYVRWLEVRRSAEFADDLLGSLPGGDVRASCGALAPDHLCVSLVEGWRGEICHVGWTDGSGRLAGYKIVDPSFHNWIGLALALRGQQISDFPLCNKSFNLSYCGFDL